MSRTIKTDRYVVIHTDGDEDVSFQKAAWPMAKREKNLETAYYVCEQEGMDARRNMCVIGFNQDDMTFRRVFGPDRDLYNKIEGNIILTDCKELVLMGWASDCCLVAFVADDGEMCAVCHASVNTFHHRIIERTVGAMRGYGAHKITAFVGACAGSCCYEYGEEKARCDFAGYESFILPSDVEGKVYLDLNGAVSAALRNEGCEVVDIYEPGCRCSICSKFNDGTFMFPSFRRDVDADGKHINGQYGLFVWIK